MQFFKQCALYKKNACLFVRPSSFVKCRKVICVLLSVERPEFASLQDAGVEQGAGRGRVDGAAGRLLRGTDTPPRFSCSDSQPPYIARKVQM